MSRGTRIALFVGLGLVLLVVATCGGVYACFQMNADRLAEEGKAAMRDGAHFGGGQQAPACVDEALRRLDQGDLGIVGEATNKVFLEACLGVAARPAGFCDGIPPRDQLIASATWAVARCGQLGHPGSQPCSRLVGAIQERCLAP
ncbi:MAG: hypothetical protein HYS27_00630 [Deltaproteobacteria bacterium]|nr:hypothetical protein [Deltaproteobacteria bacterium]